MELINLKFWSQWLLSTVFMEMETNKFDLQVCSKSWINMTLHLKSSMLVSLISLWSKFFSTGLHCWFVEYLFILLRDGFQRFEQFHVVSVLLGSISYSILQGVKGVAWVEFKTSPSLLTNSLTSSRVWRCSSSLKHSNWYPWLSQAFFSSSIIFKFYSYAVKPDYLHSIIAFIVFSIWIYTGKYYDYYFLILQIIVIS